MNKNIAIITGASSGLGYEFALQLDSYSLDEIWLVARREEKLRELSSKLKTPAKTLVLDLTEKSSFDSIKFILESEKPRIKYLINNAGFGKTGFFADKNIALKSQIDMVDLNSRAPVHLTYLCLDYLSKGSEVIMLSSVASFQPLPGFAVYAATKSFLTSFGVSLSKELKQYGISVCTVCPGPVKTEFGSISNMDSTIKSKQAEVTPVVKKALKDSADGKCFSVYGFLMNFVSVISKFLPRSLTASIIYAAMAKMIKKGS